MSKGGIEVHYRLTPDDYVRSSRHNSWRSFRWVALGIAVLLPVGIYLVIVERDYANYALLWSVLMAAYLALFFKLFLPRRARRIFDETKSLHQEMHLQLFGDHAAIESESGVYRLPWRDVYKWDEFAGLLAIYPSSAMVILIPATQVDDATRGYIGARLKEVGLPRRGKARRR